MQRTGRPAPHVHQIDLAKVPFDDAATDLHPSKRAWQTIDQILREFLGVAGHYHQLSDDRIRLLRPNLGHSLGKLKCEVIIGEIVRRLGVTRPEPAAPAAGSLRPRRMVSATVRQDDGLSAEDRQHWSRALANMIAAPAIDTPTLLDQAGDTVFSFAPILRVKVGLMTGNLIQVLAADGADDRNWLPPTESGLMAFEFVDIPGHLRKSRLDEWMARLRPLCRTIVMRTDLTRSDFQQFTGLA